MWPRLPPLPEGALGWNVYAGAIDPQFIKFFPDETAVAREAAKLVEDIEAFMPGDDGQPGSTP